MNFETVGSGSSEGDDKNDASPSHTDNVAKGEKGKIRWDVLERNPTNKTIIIATFSLGGEGSDVIELLKQYGDLSDSEKRLLKHENFKNRIRTRYGSRQQLLAHLETEPITSTPLYAKTFHLVRHFLLQHAPEKLWQKDREFLPVAVYLLQESGLTLNAVGQALARAMRVKLSPTLFHRRVARYQEKLKREAPHRDKVDLERNARVACCRDLLDAMSPMLTAAELEHGRVLGERWAGEVMAGAYAAEDSWRRDSRARALAADMLERHTPIPMIQKTIAEVFGYDIHYDSIYDTLPTRLRWGTGPSDHALAQRILTYLPLIEEIIQTLPTDKQKEARRKALRETLFAIPEKNESKS